MSGIIYWLATHPENRFSPPINFHIISRGKFDLRNTIEYFLLFTIFVALGWIWNFLFIVKDGDLIVGFVSIFPDYKLQTI